MSASTSRPGKKLGIHALGGLLLAMAAGGAQAGQVSIVRTFDAPQVVRDGGYDRVRLEGALSYGAPGEPVLPRAGVQALLPPGEVLTRIEVIPGEAVALPGSYRIAPGQPQHPLSDAGPHAAAEPNAELYASSAPLPAELHGAVSTGWFRGHAIASVPLHPVQFVPAEGRLVSYRSLEVVFHTAPAAEALEQCRRMLRGDATTRARVARLVDNPGDLSAYDTVAPAPRDSQRLDPEEAITYLIVAGDDYEAALGPLAEFETRRGHKAGIFTRTWILQTYTGGVDEQDNIRDFVIDAYQTWGADYLLLVGDAREAGGIPHRGLYSNTAYGTSDTDIPADLYYGCLDGTWNADGDNRWGEPGEEDFYHEVGVGRACVDSQQELQNFITKQMRYQSAPVVADCDEALMVGELLWSDPTWGGDYKDEIKDGSSNHGYTTAGFPTTMTVGTLYDRTATWSKTELINRMNSGLNIINHLGHCNVTYAMKMDNPDIASFTNDGLNHTYNFVYSQGCYCGSFDNRTDGGSYTSDCFAEQFTADDHGAAAVVMNSRYGWGEHMSTNGSSQYFDRQFFDAIFGEAIYPLAHVNDDSKMDNVWAISYGANRYCYYELNLFGDPAMELWTATPAALDVDHPEVVFIGQAEIDVAVATLGGQPMAGARVTIYTDDLAVYATGLTDATGHVLLEPNCQAPGTLHVTATAHDHLAFAGSLPIVPPSGPYLVFDGCAVEDPQGDQDGLLDWAEAAGLAITLENVGIENTTGVSATLTSLGEGVTVLTPTRTFPDIAAGASGCCLDPYAIQVAGDVADQQVVRFALAMHAGEGDWQSEFGLTVQAPVLAYAGQMIDDAAPHGDGDGGADPGETIGLQLWLANSGHSAARDLDAVLACSSPTIQILDGEGTCLSAGVGEGGLLGAFRVRIDPSCPEPLVVDFTVELTGPAGFVAALTFPLDVGAWFDDVETDRGWQCGMAGDTATAGHWARLDPLGTYENGVPVQPEDDHTAAPGAICFVTANGTGGASGEADVDGGRTTLLTPIFDLSDALEARVSYWRWYTNDLGNNPGQDWWTVDVTNDGANWTHLESTQASDNAWTFHEFDLLQHVTLTDRVQMRFIAEDLSPGSLVEAAVDDFSLTVVRAPMTGVGPAEPRPATAIVSWGRNPLGSAAVIHYRLGAPGRVDLALFDVSGRRVRTLARGEAGAGQHEAAFDGCDGRGRRLAAGVYFLRLETPELMQVRQVSIVH